MDQMFECLSFQHLRRFLYLVKPSEAQFIKDVPNYFDEVVSWFTILMFLEFFVIFLSKKYLKIGENLTGTSTNDTLTSLHSSKIMLLVRQVRLPLYLATLHYVHDNWRLLSLPWNCAYTWLLCVIWTDFLFYLFHRAAHEIGILWALHQMHHSSEYFNMSTAMRQSGPENLPKMLWDVFNALLFPVPVVLVHSYFNMIYQIWIHTELVPALGPLEYILNTASAHRVHHGRNPYCIDKNYGGTFIVFDRLFGTYEAERRDERIVYGLVAPVRTFDQCRLQLGKLKFFLWDKPAMMRGWPDKIRAVFYPPGWGWLSGTRLRRFMFWYHVAEPTEGIPKIDRTGHHEPYNVPLARWQFAYAWLQIAFMNMVYHSTAPAFSSGTDRSAAFWLHALWQLAGMQSAGGMFEQRRWADWLELCKNAAAVMYATCYWRPAMSDEQSAFAALSAVAALFWAGRIMYRATKVKAKTL